MEKPKRPKNWPSKKRGNPSGKKRDNNPTSPDKTPPPTEEK